MRQVVYTVEIPSNFVSDFKEKYVEYMNEYVNDFFVGTKVRGYSFELKEENVYTIWVDTEKRLNQGSTQMINYRTNGFYSGYCAAKGIGNVKA